MFRFSDAPYNVDLTIKIRTPANIMMIATSLMILEAISGHF
jgi:hypothetical protein